MSYSTPAELEERYGVTLLVELSDRGAVSSGEVDAALIGRAISDADAEIDGYLRARYRLPLVAVPPQLRDLSLRIAIYKAHGTSVVDKIRRDYEDAVRALKLIADGAIRLDIEGAEPLAAGTHDVRMTDTARPITVSSMRGFI